VETIKIADAATAPLLEAESLSIRYDSAVGPTSAVSDLSLSLSAGDSIGILGESGCGKTSLAHALIGLLPKDACLTAKCLNFRGCDLRAFNEREWRKMRGAEIAFIPQEPSLTLNPFMRVGDQVTEAVRAHSIESLNACKARARDA
jgi:peptide/nickel transport system ATP-binding protein